MLAIQRRQCFSILILIASIVLDATSATFAEDKNSIAIITPTTISEPLSLEKRQALLDAIEEGDVQKVELYLKPGIDPNVVSAGEDGPLLYYAIKTGQRKAAIVEFLIKQGAQASYSSEEGYSPLHWLVDINGISSPDEEQKIVQALLRAGADIEARNHYGWTPLMGAVLQGSLSETEALLKAGANPNEKYTQDSMPLFTRGLTLLMVAGGQPDKVKLLLEYGADAQLQNDVEQTTVVYLETLLAEVKSSTQNIPRDFQKSYIHGLEKSLAMVKSLNKIH